MNPEHQLNLGGSGDYSPSKRASAGASAATGTAHRPVKTDGPSTGGSDSARAGTGPSDNPRQNAGGKVPSQNAQSGSDKLDSARSVNDRRA